VYPVYLSVCDSYLFVQILAWSRFALQGSPMMQLLKNRLTGQVNILEGMRRAAGCRVRHGSRSVRHAAFWAGGRAWCSLRQQSDVLRAYCFDGCIVRWASKKHMEQVRRHNHPADGSWRLWQEC
jgi:hypothetical protein